MMCVTVSGTGGRPRGQRNPLQCANLGLRRLLLQHGRPNERADHQNNTADLRQRQRFPEQGDPERRRDHRLRVAQQRTTGRTDHRYRNEECNHGEGVEESRRRKSSPAPGRVRQSEFALVHAERDKQNGCYGRDIERYGP